MTVFFVPGVPVAQGRPRCRCLRMGRKAIPQIYNPHDADEWKAVISIIARQSVKSPLAGPVRLSATFFIDRPKSHYGTGRNATKLRDDAPLWHTTKPDSDNFVKALKDAMTGIAWVDDSQVCDERTQKIYTSDRKPGCMVSFQAITTEPIIEIEPCLPSFTTPKNTSNSR